MCVALFTNHPKQGDVASFNQALCGLYAAGLGSRRRTRRRTETATGATAAGRSRASRDRAVRRAGLGERRPDWRSEFRARLASDGASTARAPGRRPVVVTGAGLGLPGAERVFDDENVARILDGEQFIDVIPAPDPRGDARQAHHAAGEDARTATRRSRRSTTRPTSSSWPARAGAFDLEEEFGVAAERVPALDRDDQLAIGAGLDALRDAGIPLVHALQDDHHGHAAARPVGAARRRCATTPA